MFKGKYELEERITSIRFGTQIMLSFSLAYVIKMAAFFFGLLNSVIPLGYFRIIASVLFSLPVAFGLLIIGMFGKYKVLKYVVSLFDFVVFLYVFDINNHPDKIKVVFFSLFGAFISFQLNDIFSIRQHQEKSGLKQRLSEILKSISDSEQTLSVLNQKIAEINKRTCPKCENIYKSINGLNAHINSCTGKQGS